MKNRTRLMAAILLTGTATPALAQTAPGATTPQEQPPEPEDEEGVEVVVTGARERGAVEGEIPPELQLSPADIRTYGASSVSELLEALAPQTRSGRGRGGDQPVVLLNGRRISGFAEVRDLPTEAILRVDILPEEVALKYGYRADQRVVNFVLRPRFRAYTAEGNLRVPTAGGTMDGNVQAGVLRINRDGRLNIDLQYQKQTKLLEEDRGIVASAPSQPFDLVGNVVGTGPGGEIDPALSVLAGSRVTLAGVPGGPRTLGAFAATAGRANVTNTTPFRTLRPSSDRFSANATYSRTILGDVSATFNGRVESNASESRLGLPSLTLAVPGGEASPFGAPVTLYRYLGDDGPLVRENRNVTARGAVSLNGQISSDWRWSLNASYDRNETRTNTDRGIDATALQAAVTAGTVDPFGPSAAFGPLGRNVDTARSVSSVANIDALISGKVVELPAGAVNTAIRFGGTTSDFSSRSLRAGIAQTGGIARDSAVVRANIDIPIANAARDVLAPLGRLSFNGNAEVEQLSDFGTLTTLGYGLNWSPIDRLRLIASMTHEEGAPSASQLGNPTVLTPNTRVFDFVRGETVDIVRIDGGNPGLSADNRRAFKLGFNFQPWEKTQLSFRADYNSSRIDNPIAGFPAATAAIEAALPERFTRDGAGQLLRIDNRPVNFARQERSELRYGFDFSAPITSKRQREMQAVMAAAREQRQARRAERQADPDRAPGARPGGGRGPGGGGFGGRGGGFGGRGFGGGAGGRLQLSAYHTVRLQESILIRPGVPELDLLDGAATGSRGGQPRHEVEVNTGLTRDGFGVRLEGKWQSATRVDGGVGGAQDLRFGALTTVNLRLFANLGQRPEIVRKHPFLRGSRLTLGVDNVFNERIDVTDSLGITPLNYQPGYLDALGRTVRLGFRKLF